MSTAEIRDINQERADTMLACIGSEEEPEADALLIQDAMGTEIYLSPREGSGYEVYIRNRARYEQDYQITESEQDIRQLVAGAIQEEVDGQGSSVNYRSVEETPLR